MNGGGSSQSGGWHLTSKTGGESPVRGVAINAPETKDVGLLLDVLGSHNFGELSGIGKKLVEGVKVITNIENAPGQYQEEKNWHNYGDTNITENYWNGKGTPYYIKEHKTTHIPYGPATKAEYDKQKKQKSTDNYNTE